MKKAVLIAMMVGLLGSSAWADRLHLKSGQTMDGGVSFDGAYYQLMRGAAVTQYPAADVITVEKVETDWDAYNAKFVQTDWANAANILALVDFARARSLQAELQPLYRKVLAVDPNSIEANRALKRVKLNDNWMEYDDAMTLRGMVKVEDKWITREEIALRRADAMYQEQARAREEKIAQLFEQLLSKDQQLVTKAREEIHELDQEMPGLAKRARQAEQWYDSNPALTFDGKYLSMVLRLNNVMLDPQSPGGGMEPRWLALGNWGNVVRLDLPHVLYLEVRSTLMIPVR